MQIQEHQELTPSKQHELGARFLEAQGRGVSWGKNSFGGDSCGSDSIDALLVTCASCGCRDFECDGNQYVDLTLANGLDVLKMNDEDWKCHSDRLYFESSHRLEIPVSNDYETKIIKASKVYSMWPQDDNKISDDLFDESKKAKGSRKYDDRLFEIEPHSCDDKCATTENGDIICLIDHGPRYKRYHLHPEFVEEYKMDNGKYGIRAKICRTCHDSIKDGKIPELSLANGVDFGDYRRIGLTPLTLRERHIISKVRHFINIIKIEGSNKEKKGREEKEQYNHHSAMKGCGIIFDHDCPQVVKKLLTPESINGDVQLQFVCHEGEYDRLVAKAIGSANVKGRAFVIYQWLAVLKHINKWYKHDKLVPHLEMSYFHEFKHLIDECNNDLIHGAIRTDKTVERVANIARDDVAGIRSTTSSNSKRSEEEEEEVELECDFPMRCVNLTSSTKTKYNHRDDVDHLFFVEAAQTLKVDVKDSKTRYEAAKVTKSYRERNPVNEFLTGDEGLVKAHVDVFLLGTAYDKKHVSPHLTARQRNHLLMQFTTNAASCICLIFHLFDQMQRHSSIRSVHAKTMNMKKFQGFVKEVTSDDFQVKLRNAVANPSSPDGRYVMKKLVPMLASAGRTTTFGALERDRSKGEILALGRRFGLCSDVSHVCNR